MEHHATESHGIPTQNFTRFHERFNLYLNILQKSKLKSQKFAMMLTTEYGKNKYQMIALKQFRIVNIKAEFT